MHRHRVGSVQQWRILHRSIIFTADPSRDDARRGCFVILDIDFPFRFIDPSIRFSPGSDGELCSGMSSGEVRQWHHRATGSRWICSKRDCGRWMHGLQLRLEITYPFVAFDLNRRSKIGGTGINLGYLKSRSLIC